MPEAAYRVGAFINGTYRNRRFGRAIIRASNPEAIADAFKIKQWTRRRLTLPLR